MAQPGEEHKGPGEYQRTVPHDVSVRVFANLEQGRPFCVVLEVEPELVSFCQGIQVALG